MKTKVFTATLLLHNLPSATNPPSAKRFFIALWQCYLEMKTKKEPPYFSILSFIILCIKQTISGS